MKWNPLAASGEVLAMGMMATSAQVQPRLPEAATPVGTWSGTVTRRGEPESIQLTFTESRRACLLTSDGESQGSWVPADPAGFDYEIVEALTDSSTGQPAGSVHITQNAQQDMDGFTSSGLSQVFDQNGKLIRSVTSTVSVTRMSTQ
jgi:hypothetical protein